MAIFSEPESSDVTFKSTTSGGKPSTFGHTQPMSLFKPENYAAKRSYEVYKGEYDESSGDFTSRITASKAEGPYNLNENKWANGILIGTTAQDEIKEPVKSIKVPLGSYIDVSGDGSKCTRTTLPTGEVAYFGSSDNERNPGTRYIIPKGDMTTYTQALLDNNYTSNQKDILLTDDTATRCANPQDTLNPHNNDCWIGVVFKDPIQPEKGCFKSGIHYGSYCQLGENIFTDTCQTAGACLESTTFPKDPKDDTYCEHAIRRVCNKGTLDNCSKDTKCSKNWFMENECKNYCGPTPEQYNENCIDTAQRHCGDPEFFKNNKDYCKKVWTRASELNKFNPTYVDNLFKTEINNENLEQNNVMYYIKDNKKVLDGVANLCSPGNEINKNYCMDKKKKFCMAGDNMKLKECLDYAKDATVVTKVDSKVYSKDELVRFLQDGICKDVQNHDDMDEEIVDPFTNSSHAKLGNYCGCVMNDKFYDQYFQDVKANIKTTGSFEDKNCFYPYCDQEAPGLNTQACPDCVQNIISNIDESTFDDTTININQDGSCKISKNVDPKPDPKPKPGPSPAPPSPSPTPFTPVEPIKPGPLGPFIPVVPIDPDPKPDPDPPSPDPSGLKPWSIVLIVTVVIILLYFLFR